MRTTYIHGLLALAACTALPWATDSANAQNSDREGIVRISDCAPAGDNLNGPCTDGSCGNGACGHGYGGHYGGGWCRHGYGSCSLCSTGYCRGPLCAHLHHKLSVLSLNGPCTFSPDHGWAPPGKIPIERVSVAYNSFFPASWMGQTAARGTAQPMPQIYMPTDTTQLGYYYQHVPQWLPYPNMVPPVPNPAEWHVPLCAVNLNGYGCPPGQYTSGTPVYEGIPVQKPAATPTEVPANQLPESDVPPPPAEAELERSAAAPALIPIPE